MSPEAINIRPQPDQVLVDIAEYVCNHAISSTEADIVHLDMGSEPAAETAELRLLISVRDRVHLDEVLRNLRRTKSTLRADRGKR